MLRKLTEAECRDAIAGGEFPDTIRDSAPYIAVVLTQSWCPQWTWMRSCLDEISLEPGVDIYWLEYDREPFFDAFIDFKENVLGDSLIPYVRYYRQGVLAHTSNYIDRRGFLRLLEG
ncbi:MAG: hypothetical protein NT061_12985 [Spirochaetes bacterium]|nr:hypothetical protein [Spirochaetota bacterium]